jgi:PDZ domain
MGTHRQDFTLAVLEGLALRGGKKRWGRERTRSERILLHSTNHPAGVVHCRLASQGRLVRSLFLLVLFIFTPQRAYSQTVHAVLCVPTEYKAQSPEKNDSTNKGAAIGLQDIRSILNELPGENQSVTELTGEDFNANTLLRTIRNLRPAPNDTVFVYVVAHGSFDPDHRFSLHVGNERGKQDIGRHKLTAEVRRHDVRLGVLITESCGVIANEDIDRVKDIFRGNRTVYTTQSQTRNGSLLLNHLLLTERGYVDFLSASAGQPANYNTEIGPFFTRALWCVVDANLDRKLSWDQIFLEAKKLVANGTRNTQIPLAVSTPTISKRNYALFDMSVEGLSGKVRIAEIDKGGNIDQLGLKEGDVIAAINGTRISTTGQYLLVGGGVRKGSQVHLLIERNGALFEVTLDLSN